MIRRGLIEENHIVADESFVANDIMFSLRLGLAADKIVVLNEPLYCLTWRSESLVNDCDISRIKTRILTHKRANDTLHEHGLDQYRILGLWWPWMKRLLPNHPFLFIWGLWVSRYKDAPLEYIRDNLQYVSRKLSRKIKRQFRKIKRFIRKRKKK